MPQSLDDPATMTPQQRRHEIAAILARGVLRLRAEKKGHKPIRGGEEGAQANSERAWAGVGTKNGAGTRDGFVFVGPWRPGR